MKAAVCYEFGQPLVIEELQIDPPRSAEVKVKLAACAICHSDIHVMEGAWGGKLPAVYGHEAAGVVEEIGPQVKHIKPGCHVLVTLIRSCGHCFYCEQGDLNMCEGAHALDTEQRLHTRDGKAVFQGIKTGAFAEYVVVDESQVVTIPDEIPMDSASVLSCGVITGLGAVVNTAKVPSGSSVVVIGTGGVGLNSVQGARLVGANPIIAVDIADDKLQAARSFGATHGINSAQEELTEQVRLLTGGRGADFVFVTVGAIKAFETAPRMLAARGEMIMVGMPPSGAMASYEPVMLTALSQSMKGSLMGETVLKRDIPWLIEQYRQGRLKLDELITNRYSLDQINEAIADTKAGKSRRNVIVF